MCLRLNAASIAVPMGDRVRKIVPYAIGGAVLALVFLLLCIGALNAFILRPRLERIAGEGVAKASVRDLAVLAALPLGTPGAVSGASLSDQIEAAREELGTLLPWIDWQGARFRSFRIDRILPVSDSLLPRRTDQATVERIGRLKVEVAAERLGAFNSRMRLVER